MTSHNAILTLCLAAAAGTSVSVVAQRLAIPSILLCLIGGAVLGPQLLGWLQPASLDGGLLAIIPLIVAVIVFEGGLAFDREEYRRAPVTIRRLVTVGALVTWGGASGAVWLLFGLAPGMALMAGSLVLITGPTAVLPLLRRIRARDRVHHILYWEAILIEAAGVCVAVLCYEWLTPDPEHPLWQPLATFGLRVAVGVGLGLAAGVAVARTLRNDWVPTSSVSLFLLGAACLTFGVAHVLVAESGLLAVVVAGLVVGLRQAPQVDLVQHRDHQIRDVLICGLFILLAARLDLALFVRWEVLAFVMVVLLLRPVAVWVASWGRHLELREKVLLSWVTPRGIVAASMASLFAVWLQELGRPEAAHIETLTYAVVGATATLQALPGPWLTRMLGQERPKGRTWVLLGHKTLVGALGAGLRRAGVSVVALTGRAAVKADPDHAGFTDTQAVLCAHTTLAQNIRASARFGQRPGRAACHRWATLERHEAGPGLRRATAADAVWASAANANTAAVGLADGSLVVDVVDVGTKDELCRFDAKLRPLFWVDDGQAHIIPDPSEPGPPQGDLAVVLKRRITGLQDLIVDVQVLQAQDSPFESVLHQLAGAAKRLHPELPMEDLIRGIIDRRETMPVAIGGGIAIPHGYCDGLDRSRCFMAVVPHGVVDLLTPDDTPVCLVFLLVSPSDSAIQHVESLASLTSLGHSPTFVRLLCRQRVPQRVARLISERAS